MHRSNLVGPGASLVGAVVLTLAGATDAFAADPTPQLPPGVDTKLNAILGILMACVIAACVAGVLVCAGKLALAFRHGEGAEVAGKLIGVAVACILVGSAAGIVRYLV